MDPHVSFVLEFFHDLFDSGLGYSAINTARSALSSFLTLEGRPLGQHPLVIRFLKSVFQQRPALPRNNTTWEVNVVLNYLRTLSPVKRLPLADLTKKLVVLLLLVSGQRGQTIHSLDVQNMSITKSKVVFRIPDLLKTSRPGSHLSEVIFLAYAPDRRLCVYTVLLAYLRRTLSIRGTCKQLLLTTQKPFHAASRDSIRRWTKEVLAKSGIDIDQFTPHSTRAASVSKAAIHQVPLDSILQTADWSSAGTFQKYYKKPINTKTQSFQAAVLGGK